MTIEAKIDLVSSSADAASPKGMLSQLCATSGTAAGQCKNVRGIAVNSTGAGGVVAGSVYVVDQGNARIQQFSPAGAFVRAFGLGVDQTTGGNVCTAASGDTCKAGTASAAAGSVNQPYGITVDQATGAVYISSVANRRIDVFSAAGAFEGAIGWNVDAAPAAEELQFCSALSGCKAGVAGPAAGQLASLEAGLAIDPRDGHLYVADRGNRRIAEYEIDDDGAGEVTGATFLRAFGWKVNAAAPAQELQVCTSSTGCLQGSAGGGAGQFLNLNPGPIAVDSSGAIYAVNFKATGNCTAAEPCGVLKFNPDGTFAEAFGPSSGECQLAFTTGVAPAEEAFEIAVDPVLADHDDRVYVARLTAAGQYRVYEFNPEGTACTPSPSPDFSALTFGLAEFHGLAVGPDGRLYVDSIVPNAAGAVIRLGDSPPPTVAFGALSGVDATSVHVTGSVTPPAESEGNGVATVWHFEYSTDQAHWIGVPAPPSAAGAVPGVPVPVAADITGLAPATTYFVRLCATSGPAACDPSPPVEFTTEATGPTIVPFSAEVTQTGATLGAEIDPNNLATRYHIEWATPDEWALSPGTYGHRLPAGDRQIGAGSDEVLVNESLRGLDPAGLYHFRVVATNSAGTTMSADQQVETLDSCGLTDGRCFELVSRADKGPLASPGVATTTAIQFQPAAGGSALAYTVAFGYPDATEGFGVIDLARRSSAGWSSEQLTPPLLTPPLTGGQGGSGGAVRALSSDLGCGVVSSLAPLAPGASTSLVEAGGENLYRRDDVTGSYRAMTTLPPVDPQILPSSSAGVEEYLVLGMSPDCARVVFRTRYIYPGIPAVTGSKSQLYEWDHGTIRNVALIPGPGGGGEPVPAESLPGAMDAATNNGLPIGGKKTTDYWHAVSASAARSVFTAISRFGADSGRRAIFLRDGEDPAVLAGTVPATDISQSETATPNNGNSRFWTASTDGRRVFFTARYGLAADGSSSGANVCSNEPAGGTTTGSGAGCDLYEYDADAPAGERLTDLTPDTTDAGGAGVAGVLDASEDGSYVYFAARGRLGGAGRSETENLASATFNVYLGHGGSTEFVGPLGQTEALNSSGTALMSTGSWTSRATPDGGTLVFESSLGGPSGASPRVYLFSAADGSTVCASCRHDGRPPFSEHALVPLLGVNEGLPVLKDLTANGRLYFYSFDPLATGAVEGNRNLYQWEHGQISLIASEPATVPRSGGVPLQSIFGGASADGADVYFTSPLALVGADHDERWDVYDARVGGGFPEPLAPPPPCDAAAEGACNAGPAAAPTGANPATQGFTGPADPRAKPAKKKHKRHLRHQHKRHGKHQKRRGKKHERTFKAGRANRDRRAAQ